MLIIPSARFTINLIAIYYMFIYAVYRKVQRKKPLILFCKKEKEQNDYIRKHNVHSEETEVVMVLCVYYKKLCESSHIRFQCH